MKKPDSAFRRVLITGGTSGLGLELVRLYIEKGFEVVATGRNPSRVKELKKGFEFFPVDFSELNQIAATGRKICENYNFDIVINNAGVLSPPDLIITGDYMEYTFQVNFLSHLLLNEIIIENQASNRNLIIAAITSPVYRVVEPDLNFQKLMNTYKPFKAYSLSKLFLALMCGHFSEKFGSTGLKCFGYDPGIFSSGIFRMQKRWFRFFYAIGAFFMKSPSKIAGSLTNLIEDVNLKNGSVYDFRERVQSIPVINSKALNDFWKECYSRIDQFLC